GHSAGGGNNLEPVHGDPLQFVSFAGVRWIRDLEELVENEPPPPRDGGGAMVLARVRGRGPGVLFPGPSRPGRLGGLPPGLDRVLGVSADSLCQYNLEA